MDNENNKKEQERLNTENDSTPEESLEVNHSFENAGMEENSVDQNNDSIEQWVKGISESDGVEKEKNIADIEHLEVKKGDLPDWINTLSESGPESFNVKEDFNESLENIDSIKFKSMDDSWGTEPSIEEDDIQDKKAPAIANADTDEGFIEISSYEINQDKSPGDEPSSFQRSAEEGEELPDWLEDMIAEPNESTQEESQIPLDDETLFEDESTKPVTIVNENFVGEQSTGEELINQEFVDEELIEEELIDEEFVDEQFTDQEFIEEEFSDIEFSDEEHFPEEDHFEEPYLTAIDVDQVVQGEKFEEDFLKDHFVEEIQEKDLANEEDVFSIEEQDQEQVAIQEEPTTVVTEGIKTEVLKNIQQEDWESENIQSVEIPKTLRFGKYLLDQGEIDPAFEIFQTYVKKPEHLENIKAWVSEAIRDEENPSSLLWELLGDIEYKQNEHNKALSAYTKAISMLISQPKG